MSSEGRQNCRCRLKHAGQIYLSGANYYRAQSINYTIKSRTSRAIMVIPLILNGLGWSCL